MSGYRTSRDRARWRGAFALAVVLTILGAALLAPGKVWAADFGQPIPGVHVYDRTGLLTPTEIADLESRSAAVERAGAPTVVYLQAKDASQSVTMQDARDLMDAWDLQSAPNARDGLVIFFNLKPGDLRHGTGVIVAGQKHFQGGALTQSVLDRIWNQRMAPLLQEGRTADGIAAGLDAAAAALTGQPPEPSRRERLGGDLAGSPLSPLNVAGALLAVAGLFVGFRIFRTRPLRPGGTVASTGLPGSRPPAEVGALVSGRINDAQIEGTLLHLATRDALAIEPAGRKKVQIRLLDRAQLHGPFEEAIWDVLTEAADPASGIVSSASLSRLRSRWGWAKELLRSDLVAQGFYDPNARDKRRPLWVLAIAAFALGVVGFVFAMVSRATWGILSVGVLLLMGVVLIIMAVLFPDTTAMGEAEAAPWRGYQDGIKTARRDKAAVLELDEVMPYAAALGVTASLDKRLKEASEAGYIPIWLGRTMAAGQWDGGFYPYWAAFHTTVTPAPSGGAGGGGASAGSGGSGGSF